MIDPEFMADLQRAPDTVLSQFELTDAELKAVHHAIIRLSEAPANQRAREFHSALIRRVAT